MENSPEFYRGVYQAILGEEPRVTDPVAREDVVFYRLGELVDEEILTPDESMECWTQYVSQTRPDTVVIHLGQTVSKPFYE
jgi:hypothetical protein